MLFANTTLTLLRSYGYAISIFGVLACTKNDPELAAPEHAYFSIEIGDGYFAGSTVAEYAMIHDKNGVLLSAQRLTNGVTVEFDTIDTAIPRTFAVTLLSVDFMHGRLTGESFYGEVAGEKWRLQGVELPEKQMHWKSWGQEYLYFSGDNREFNHVGVSRLYVDVNYCCSNLDEGNFPMWVSSDEGDNNLLARAYKDNQTPLYKWFVASDVPQSFTLDDLFEFDTTVDVLIPDGSSAFMRVDGYSSKTPVYHKEWYTTNQATEVLSSVKIGYNLNEFPHYVTTVRATDVLEKKVIHYTSIGAPAISRELKYADIAYSGDSFENYQFVAHEPVVRTTALFSGYNTILGKDYVFTWRVHDGGKSFLRPQGLPKEVLLHVPDLTSKLISHKSTEVFTEGESMTELLQNRFKDHSPKEIIRVSTEFLR